jgi:pilus assembly protein CpaB
MRTRIIAVAVAAVLAIVGAVVLVVGVNNANQSAAAGAQLTSVLVVRAEIPAGTAADHLGDAIGIQKIPAAYAARGAVTDVADLEGLVASVDLEPGEQLLTTRFSSPEQLASSGAHAAVPEGMQEVAIAVDLQRIAGGNVGPGGHVGVFASFDGTSGDTSTRLLLNQVLVTSVASTVANSDDTQAQGLVLVTLALSADDAQDVVYAAEFGHIWMSLQTEDSKPATGGPVTSAAVN